MWELSEFATEISAGFVQQLLPLPILELLLLPILNNNNNNNNNNNKDMGGACGAYGGGERCAQGSGGKT